MKEKTGRQKLRYVGKPTPRVDARDKVTGRTKFLKDLVFPQMLHAKMVMSPLPHARIEGINVKRAAKLKGVEAVMSHNELPGVNQAGLIVKDQPLLAVGKVRFAGDVIAVIAAEDEGTAARAASSVDFELKPLPALYSARKSASTKRPLIHRGGNVFTHWKIRKGNHELPLKGADVVIEAELGTQHQEHAYLETLGTVVVPHGDGSITICGSIQCPYYVQRTVSEVLRIPYNRVRIVQTATGGAFGGKEDVPSEICARAAALAVVTGRPVRLTLDRAEDARYSSKRHPFEMTYRLGAKKDGRLTGASITQYAAAGAYATLSPVVMFRAIIHAAGPYVIPNVRADTYAVYTNHPPSGAFRGFGAPQSAFGIERAMDILAGALDMDPLDLRERNMLRTGKRTATNQLLRESVGLAETLREARRVSKWDVLRKNGKKDDRYSYGTGAACMHYGNCLGAMGWYLDGAGAYVQVHRDGSISVSVGITELGQGSTTTLTQMAAEALGVSVERIRVLEVDTAMVPDSGPTVASRSTIMSGNAILDAAKRLRPGLASAASRLLGIPPSRVRFAGDKAFEAGSHRNSVSFVKVAEEAFVKNERLAAAGWWAAPYSTWDPETGIGNTYFAYSFATHVVKVRVDRLTGQVKVLEVTAAHDVGKAINPEGVRSQAEGGIVQGIGYALTEDLKFENGILLNPLLSTYIIPSSLETPKIRVIIVEDKGKDGPFGAKSMGEPPMIPIAAAVANAVSDALGVPMNSIPITPENLLRNLKEL